MQTVEHSVEIIFRETTRRENIENKVKAALNYAWILIARRTIFETFDTKAIARIAEIQGIKIAEITFSREDDTELDEVRHNLQVRMTITHEKKFRQLIDLNFINSAFQICLATAFSQLRPVELSLLGKSTLKYEYKIYDYTDVTILENKFEDYSNFSLRDKNID